MPRIAYQKRSRWRRRATPAAAQRRRRSGPAQRPPAHLGARWPASPASYSSGCGSDSRCSARSGQTPRGGARPSQCRRGRADGAPRRLARRPAGGPPAASESLDRRPPPMRPGSAHRMCQPDLDGARHQQTEAWQAAALAGAVERQELGKGHQVVAERPVVVRFGDNTANHRGTAGLMARSSCSSASGASRQSASTNSR